MDIDRARVIQQTLAQMDKQFGKGAVLQLGPGNGGGGDLQRVDLGRLGLGCGRVPARRVVEIFGPESSGKATLALQVIAEAQVAGGVAAFVDAEHALDPTYARKLGVDVDNLLVSQPDYGEQAL